MKPLRRPRATAAVAAAAAATIVVTSLTASQASAHGVDAEISDNLYRFLGECSGL